MLLHKQTVATLAALTALDVYCIEDGSLVSVASVRDLFELDKSSDATADGITVVPTNTGAGRWVRRGVSSKVWALRSEWYIDALVGDDENAGDDSENPLATFAELMRRLGDLETKQAVTVTLLSDLSESQYTVRGRHYGGLLIKGAESAVASGTTASSTPVDSTTTPVTPGLLEASSLDFTGMEGQLVRLTSGTNAGAGAWILKVDPDGGGNNTARVSEWFALSNFGLGPTFGPVAGPSAGDTFDVVGQTTMTGTLVVDTDDRGGGTYLGLLNVNLVGDAPFAQTRGWTVFFQSRLYSSDDDHIAQQIGGTVELYAVLAHSFRLGVAYDATAVLYSAGLLDADLHITGGLLECNFNSVAQFVAGGESAARASVAVGRDGRVEAVQKTARGAGIGALDLADVGAALISLDVGAILDTAAGRFWTASQAAGTFGVTIAAGGATVWPLGSNAAEAFDLDPGGPGAEFDVGGTTTDAATLGATGTVNAANNAMAVPKSA